MEREGGNVIKVNSVVLKENASELQHLERHLADILEETAQVERELGYRHSVFEEEIQAPETAYEDCAGAGKNQNAVGKTAGNRFFI